MPNGSLSWCLLVLLLTGVANAQNKRDLAVRKDKQVISKNKSWFYDDLPTGIEAARKTKRPLMIVFR